MVRRFGVHKYPGPDVNGIRNFAKFSILRSYTTLNAYILLEEQELGALNQAGEF